MWCGMLMWRSSPNTRALACLLTKFFHIYFFHIQFCLLASQFNPFIICSHTHYPSNPFLVFLPFFTTTFTLIYSFPQFVFIHSSNRPILSQITIKNSFPLFLKLHKSLILSQFCQSFPLQAFFSNYPFELPSFFFFSSHTNTLLPYIKPF